MSSNLSNRERIVKTLRCEPTDRAPLPMWLGLSPWGQTLERWRAESRLADLDVGTYFGLDPFFQIVPADYGPFPYSDARVIQETDEWIIAVDWRGITTRNRRDYGSMPEFINHPVHSPEEWARYKAERMQPCLDARLAQLDAFVQQMQTLDAPVQVGVFPWGVFGSARDLLGSEELLLAFYTEPEMVRDIMATYTDLWLALYERIQQRIAIDHIHIWEDMSGKQGSLISMRMVEEFMMPHYDRIVAFARQQQIPIISVDTDGRVDELVPTMLRHGVNAFMPFEAQAGNRIEAYREQYPTLGLMGGLDKNALAQGKPELHVELDRAAWLLARGGYIVGFDHLIPPNVPWENFKYFVTELKKLMGL